MTMDARKIEFLISLQKEIDRLEQSKGSDSARLDKIKSRFYDLVRVEELGTSPSTSLPKRKLNISKMSRKLGEINQDIIFEIENPIDKAEIEADISGSDVEKTPNNQEEQEHILNMVQKVGNDNSNKKLERYRGPIMPVPVEVEMKPRRKKPVKPLEDTVVDNSNRNNDNDLTVALNKLQGQAHPKVRRQESFHRPKDVADFMNLFNDIEGLKYLIHSYDNPDEIFQIDEFLIKQKIIFEEKSKEFKIPKDLFTIISQFAFTQSPKWGYRNLIHEGWSRPTWIEWSQKQGDHPMKNPEFERVIIRFVKLVRVEAPQLEEYLKNWLKEKLGDTYETFEEELKIIDCEKAYFYTNVDHFKIAIGHILDGIKKRLEKSKKVHISYHRGTEGDYKKTIIRICHFKSYPPRPVDDVISEIPSGKGDLYEVYVKLRGYCHWEIETRWDNHNVRLSILNEEDTIKAIPLDESLKMDGFTHILTFYYR